ncbi:MAG: lipoate--protein ligase family protein, partial [Chloroflexota bacterium]|nr:lipoate--protein ligase family protein [Chloroflexota bacterium]
MSSADYPRATWRLLETGYADGATNMAVDEAISLAVAEGAIQPTIRFYGWQPPCLSIGYAQSMEGDVDVAKCRKHGIDYVRRPTGGRAVLHADELTYSLALPRDDPRAAGGVIGSYRRLSLGLVLGLRSLGLLVVQAPAEREEEANSAVCFDLPAPYEITVGGKKLVGSAQVRRKRVVLQHGALPLTGDITRIINFLKVPEEEQTELKKKLRERATSLELALGR